MICALLGEGTSDRALMPILRWLLPRCTSVDTRVEWVDTQRFRIRSHKLSEKVKAALMVQPCDLLFVHRDADRQDPQLRHDEIHGATGNKPHVPVVRVRMTEAWLLIDERAMRAAVGRVSGRHPLDLPSSSRIEGIADPKRVLREALGRAHASTGHRAHRLDLESAVHRLADLVEDWSVLRQLPSFRRLEADTRETLGALGVPLLDPSG